MTASPEEKMALKAAVHKLSIETAKEAIEQLHRE